MTSTEPPLDLPPDASRQLATAWAQPVSADGETGQTGAGAGPAHERRDRRRFWQKRRFWGAALLAGAAAAAAGTAWYRGGQTRVIFINAGDTTLTGVTVATGSESHTVAPLEPGQSHRWVLAGNGHTSSMVLRGFRADGSAWEWESASLTPGDGQRLILRLDGQGGVEYAEFLSPWRTLFGD